LPTLTVSILFIDKEELNERLGNFYFTRNSLCFSAI